VTTIHPLQPIQAVDHPSFKKMIDVASRATKGVIIPGRKATRTEIIGLFKKQMARLRDCLNVSTYFKPEFDDTHLSINRARW
jgi:hypothetical protein